MRTERGGCLGFVCALALAWAGTARADEGGFGVAAEVGVARTGDAGQLYGNGAGIGFVLAFGSVEVRYWELYDLDDRSGMFENVADARGQLRITSIGYRFPVVQVGKVGVRGLAGLAWVRRPSLRMSELDFDYSLQNQHGLAAMVGGGPVLRFGSLALGADVRLYPTWWSDLAGDSRAVVDGDGMLVVAPIEESPGGLPVTVTMSLGAYF